MTVKHDDLVKLGADVKFWQRMVAECEAAFNHNTLEGQEKTRQARQQLRQAQKALRDVKRNVQMRMF